jgi:DNA-binding NtrC family response regulator
MWVVVIESDRTLRHDLAEALANAGFEPLVAATARRGLALCKKVDAELVYVSERLGAITGSDVLAELSRDPRYREVKTVFRSERLASMISLALRRRGKPVVYGRDAGEIAAIIDDLLLNRRERTAHWYARVLQRSRRLVATSRAHQALSEELRDVTLRLRGKTA